MTCLYINRAYQGKCDPCIKCTLSIHMPALLGLAIADRGLPIGLWLLKALAQYCQLLLLAAESPATPMYIWQQPCTHYVAGKMVSCSICWDEFAWGGVIDGSDTARQLTEQQATCCPNGSHLYCQSCLQRHVQSKIQDLVTSIDCPQAQACTSQAWTPKEVACFVDR